jgi:hypothetical protein
MSAALTGTTTTGKIVVGSVRVGANTKASRGFLRVQNDGPRHFPRAVSLSSPIRERLDASVAAAGKEQIP